MREVQGGLRWAHCFEAHFDGQELDDKDNEFQSIDVDVTRLRRFQATAAKDGWAPGYIEPEANRKVQKAPPPVKLASPRDSKWGSRGTTQPKGADQGVSVDRRYARSTEIHARARGQSE